MCLLRSLFEAATNMQKNNISHAYFVGDFSEGKPITPGTTYGDEEPEIENTHILPDKADFFLAYASVPGYRLENTV